MAIMNTKFNRLKDREGIRSCKATLCSKETDIEKINIFKLFVKKFFLNFFILRKRSM